MNRRAIQYTIETISPLSLTPRDQNAFYCGIDFPMDSENLDLENIKIIYPFYQYGMYEAYAPASAQYYIPGSSVKGAIGAEQISVDDIKVEPSRIRLKKLNKVQYAENASKQPGTAKQVRLDVFFQRLP